MKKITFLLGSLIVGISASAQLYVTGGNVVGAPAAWAPQTPLEVSLSNGVYKFEATGGFKISTAKGDWSTFNASAKILSGPWNKVAGGNTATASLTSGTSDISAPNPGANDIKITYEVSSNLSTIKATLPAGETYPDGGVVIYPELYLIGEAAGGWETLANPAYHMTRQGNVYSITVASLNGEWKINNGSWSFSLGQGQEGMPVVGTVYSLSDSNAANLVTSISSEVTVKVTYNEGGPYTLLLTTDGGGGTVDPPTPPTPGDVPATLYLIGNIENCQYGMNPTIGVEMTKEGNVFTCESVILDAYQGFGWFSFCTTIAPASLEEEEAWGFVNSENRFGPEVADTEVGSAPLPFVAYVAEVNASACGAWKIGASPEGKKYKFVMDFDNSTLTVTTASGVETIDAELNNNAIYYNLQGQRVDNPTNGIYVRVLNGKADKVMK